MGKLEEKGRSRHPYVLSEKNDYYLAQLVQIKEHSTIVICKKVLLKRFQT
jgi:hypothetical protein